MVAGRQFSHRGYGKIFIFISAIIIALSGTFLFATEQADTSRLVRYRVFMLRHISAEQGKKYLAEAEVGTVSQLPSPNTLLVTAQPAELIKASNILRLVDAEEEFVIKTIAPSTKVKTPASNEQIAAEVGEISIGTFFEPPSTAAKTKAIIDIHNDAVMVIAPARQLEKIISAIEQLQNREAGDEPRAASHEPQDTNEPNKFLSELLESLAEAERMAAELGIQQPAKPNEPAPKPSKPSVAEAAESKDAVEEQKLEPQPEPALEQAVVEIEEPAEAAEPAAERWSYEPEPIENGDETLELDLPEKLNIVDLLDLVGKYLNLDYLYDTAEVKGDVSLKVQGPIKVKDLYPLLESVLKFRGFVMTRKGNLVTIVPTSKVLEIDPDLRTEVGKLKYGDVIITRVFELNYIDTSSAKNLLMQMKLGTNITEIAETGTLIITGYAYRMTRIEELLEMIDKPGEPKQFRFRQLKYTMAKTLAPKIKTLVDQMGTMSITIGQAATSPAALTRRRGESAAAFRRRQAAARRGAAARRATAAKGAEAAKPTMYLDVDERTNRILMIGLEDELDVVEHLIDTLDVEQQDLRVLRLYEIQYVGAEEVMKKLEELGIIGGARPTAARAKAAQPRAAAPTAGGVTEPLVEEPQVVIIESTNSLLVNATPEQHAQIATIIGYVDSETLQQAIPYEIYALENQSPEDLAAVLQKLIQETIEDKEGKIQKVVKKEEDIVIVPDENTFSLIVYASRKNQEWIGSLIKTLDKRRPQVLIDVTLVEVSRTDLFDLDLQLATKFPKLVTGGEMDVVGAIVSPFVGRTGEIFSSPVTGTAEGFYSDAHIQALLTAMQTKSYGRVLAKPKILVNDGQAGTIQTTDTTNVEIEQVIVPDQGSPQISTSFKPYQAGITLTITPNISEGDLLLLEVSLERSDFGETPATGSPPDTTASNIDTTVTVPNNRTIILGGLVKLNQSKGGTKVPLLGDIPLLGGLFRSTSNSARDSKLYIFVKANILRPDETLAGLPELEKISDRNRAAFEEFEEKFQKLEDWPGIKPDPMDPLRVLDEE